MLFSGIRCFLVIYTYNCEAIYVIMKNLKAEMMCCISSSQYFISDVPCLVLFTSAYHMAFAFKLCYVKVPLTLQR